jgi:hypothetical protein
MKNGVRSETMKNSSAQEAYDNELATELTLLVLASLYEVEPDLCDPTNMFFDSSSCLTWPISSFTFRVNKYTLCVYITKERKTAFYYYVGISMYSYPGFVEEIPSVVRQILPNFQKRRIGKSELQILEERIAQGDVYGNACTPQP